MKTSGWKFDWLSEIIDVDDGENQQGDGRNQKRLSDGRHENGKRRLFGGHRYDLGLEKG
jgi:hypothetical protein